MILKSLNNMQRRFSKTLKIIFIAAILSVALQSQAQVVITEIMYDLSGADTGREWIEIKNSSTDAVDLSHWKLFEENVHHGLTITEGSGILSGGAFAIIADNTQKFLLDWPGFSGTLFDSTFSLSNTGETLVLKNEILNSVDSVAYDSSMGAAGTGESLQKISSGWIAQAPTPARENEDIVPSEEVPPDSEPVPETPPALPDPPPDNPEDNPAEDSDDSPEIPGDESEPPTEPQSSGNAHIRFNEIMYDLPGADTDREWIELYNDGDGATDLTDWRLAENVTDHHLELAQGSAVIEPGDFAVVVSDYEKFKLDWPDFVGSVFDSTFSLANSGETIVLKDPSFTVADQLLYASEIGANGDGKTLSRFDDTWRAALATPGQLNVLPSQTQANDPELLPIPLVRINEIAWMGVAGNQYGEWLELYNEEGAPVNLAGWTLRKEGQESPLFTFTKEIAQHGYLVVERTTDAHPDPLADIADEAGTFGGGGLSNLPGGEHLILQDLSGRIVADLDFSSGWPAGDNDTKETMQWISDAWTTARGTPGAENMITLQSAGADVSVYPTFRDTLTKENVLQVNPEINTVLSTDDSRLIDFSDVTAFSFKDRDYVYIGFANMSEKTQDLSGVVLMVDDKKFILPKQTMLLPYARIVISTKKARFNGRTFSVLLCNRELVIVD